jgi:NADH:ubiquinone oxidoreductase subunit 4 (subunit M)
MTERNDLPPGGLTRTMAKLGMALGAFGVFTCGWLAMRTDDWRKMLAYTLLAMGAAMAASAFSRRAR